MAADPPIGGDPIALSPETYARHDEAVSYVETMSRTRNPLLREGRFPGIIHGAWAVLASGDTITAASGLTLGSGSVKLCDREGTIPDGAEAVDVSNAGGTISATSGDRIVRLSWTDGEWTCNCPGST